MSDYDIAVYDGTLAIARRFDRPVDSGARFTADQETAKAVLDAAREQGTIVYADELVVWDPTVLLDTAAAVPRVLLTHRDPS